jgi:hypothetical protein
MHRSRTLTARSSTEQNREGEGEQDNEQDEEEQQIVSMARKAVQANGAK